GIPVPSRVGNLCRFRGLTKMPEVGQVLPCPAGFIGNPLEEGCVVNPELKGLAMTIPPCPAPFQVDASRGKGSQYCFFQGVGLSNGAPGAETETKPFEEAPPCPVDPEWDATEA